MANIQSVERALTLLNALSDYPSGIKITRLADLVGLTKSTTHRLLSTLINLKYVMKDEETDRYKLGFQIINLSRNQLSNMNVITSAKPSLQKLAQDVNETVHLCIEDNGEIMYVDKIESNRAVRMFSQIGSRAPMYSTGIGKVLLSGMTEARLEETISKIDFVPITKTTITTKEELIAEIKKVKKYGYALDNGENEEGLRCIAAPIYSFDGKIVAGFSISGPNNRMTMDLINNELIEKAKKTATEISQSLGYINEA